MGTLWAKEGKVGGRVPCPVKPVGFLDEVERVEATGPSSPGRPQNEERPGGEAPSAGPDTSKPSPSPADGNADRPVAGADASLGAGGSAGAAPPAFRDLHSETQCCAPHLFEGAMISVGRPFCGRWSLEHKVRLSSVFPGGYRAGFRRGGSSADDWIKSIEWDVDPDGNMNVESRVRPSERVDLSLRAQLSARPWDALLQEGEVSGDWLSARNVISLTLAAPEVAVLQISKAVSPRLIIGGEVVSDGGIGTAASVAGRWDATDRSGGWSGCAGTRGVELRHWAQVSPQLRLAAHFEMAPRRATTALCWRWADGVWTARGRLDSNGLVGCALEHAVQHAEGGPRVTLSFSALLNHVNNKFAIGFGLHTESES